MKALLGIDEGTSAVKAVLFDCQLRPLASARRGKRVLNRDGGRVEQDPAEVLEAVVDAVADVLDQAPDTEIVGCGLDHQGESVLAWDRETGAPLSPVITWQDKRSQPLLDSFSPEVRETITELSGLPVDPYFSSGKVAWLLSRGLPADTCVGTVDSYLCAQLGAGFATDLSTASRTQLAGLGERTWDDRLCEIFAVDPAVLPALRDSVGELGVLTHPRWRAELPLCAQVVDQQAALAGSGCVLPGRAKATFGTGVFVLAFTGVVAPAGAAAAGLVPTVAWSVDRVPQYALDGGVFSAGSLLEWLAGGLGLYESPREITELAASVSDAGGVCVLPALSGLGAPYWKPDAHAVISGLTASTTRAHVARAAIDAICNRVCDVLDAMAAFVEIDTLRIDGGLTQSNLLSQLQADLAQTKVELGAIDTTALGAAALAAVGAGVLRSVEEIAELVPAQRSFVPSRSSDDRAVWREFVLRAKEL